MAHGFTACSCARDPAWRGTATRTLWVAPCRLAADLRDRVGGGAYCGVVTDFTSDPGLVSRLRVIEAQPLAARAEAYVGLHDELTRRLDSGVPRAESA